VIVVWRQLRLLEQLQKHQVQVSPQHLELQVAVFAMQLGSGMACATKYAMLQTVALMVVTAVIQAQNLNHRGQQQFQLRSYLVLQPLTVVAAPHLGLVTAPAMTTAMSRLATGMAAIAVSVQLQRLPHQALLQMNSWLLWQLLTASKTVPW
jgi:hypothetical protein